MRGREEVGGCSRDPMIDLQCLPGDRFFESWWFLKVENTQKEKTDGDVDQQMVQRGVLDTNLPELWKQ